MSSPLDMGALFARYHLVVFRRCQSLLGDRHAAEDAVQAVFERAISGLGRFQLRSSPLTWLYGISTQYCLQQLRNGATARRRQQYLHFVEAAESDPSRAVDLSRAIEALTPDELQLLVLAYRDELTQEEIASVTRLSRKTVGRRLTALTVKLGREPPPMLELENALALSRAL